MPIIAEANDEEALSPSRVEEGGGWELPPLYAAVPLQLPGEVLLQEVDLLCLHETAEEDGVAEAGAQDTAAAGTRATEETMVQADGTAADKCAQPD